MIVILVIDRVGARQIKELIPDAITVWLTVPSLENYGDAWKQGGEIARNR